MYRDAGVLSCVDAAREWIHDNLTPLEALLGPMRAGMDLRDLSMQGQNMQLLVDCPDAVSKNGSNVLQPAVLLALLGLVFDRPRRHEELPLAITPGFFTAGGRLMASKDDPLSDMQAALQALKARHVGTIVQLQPRSPLSQQQVRAAAEKAGGQWGAQTVVLAGSQHAMDVIRAAYGL